MYEYGKGCPLDPVAMAHSAAMEALKLFEGGEVEKSKQVHEKAIYGLIAAGLDRSKSWSDNAYAFALMYRLEYRFSECAGLMFRMWRISQDHFEPSSEASMSSMHILWYMLLKRLDESRKSIRREATTVSRGQLDYTTEDHSSRAGRPGSLPSSRGSESHFRALRSMAITNTDSVGGGFIDPETVATAENIDLWQSRAEKFVLLVNQLPSLKAIATASLLRYGLYRRCGPEGEAYRIQWAGFLRDCLLHIRPWVAVVSEAPFLFLFHF
jgi:hypothetical protein